MLPPLSTAPTALCGFVECVAHMHTLDGHHTAAILVIPEPGDVRGVVVVRWDDDEAKAHWDRHIDGRWTYYLELPSDPPAWLADDVAKGRRLLAKHTPARQLVGVS